MSLKRSQNGVVHYLRPTRLQLRVHKALVGVLLKIRQVVAVVRSLWLMVLSKTAIMQIKCIQVGEQMLSCARPEGRHACSSLLPE